jgi:hypothetical protein
MDGDGSGSAGEELEELRGRSVVLISTRSAQPQHGLLVLSERLDRRSTQVYVLDPGGCSLVPKTANQFVSVLSHNQQQQWKSHVYVWEQKDGGGELVMSQQRLFAYHVGWLKKQQQQQQ